MDGEYIHTQYKCFQHGVYGIYDAFARMEHEPVGFPSVQPLLSEIAHAIEHVAGRV